MALSGVAGTRVYAGAPQRGPVTRLLEDERWLALVLLLPTMLLLLLFTAYPFVEGVVLSVTDTKVGVPGRFVGLHNFVISGERQHLPRRGVEHRRLYGGRHRLQIGARPVARLAAEPQLPRQGFDARLHLAALHHSDGAVDLRLEVDVRSDFQRHQLDALPPRHHHAAHQLAGRSHSRAHLGHHRQCLARRALLRDQPARGIADHQSRAQRGGGDRRRAAVAALPACDMAAPFAGDGPWSCCSR